VLGRTVTIKNINCGQQQPNGKAQITFGVYFPPQVIKQELALPWDACLGSSPGGSPAPTTEQLGAENAAVIDLKLIAPDEISYILSFNDAITNNYQWWVCLADVDHQYVIGLPPPGQATCGQPSIPVANTYIG
jgi:hypothetical protein